VRAGVGLVGSILERELTRPAWSTWPSKLVRRGKARAAELENDTRCSMVHVVSV
jgi:hypothetical protein